MTRHTARLARLERRRGGGAGPCSACPPAAFLWEDQPGDADAVEPVVCRVCGRAVVRVILGYSEEARRP